MEKMKKVEIVIDSVYLGKILELLQDSGVSGYTVIRDALGMGKRGLMAGDELTDVFKNSYILTVCTEKMANSIIERIRPMLKKFGGVCLVSDVLWVKH
jgi:nitrogen regulatory protein PII